MPVQRYLEESLAKWSYIYILKTGKKEGWQTEALKAQAKDSRGLRYINANHEASLIHLWRNVTYSTGQKQFLGKKKKTKCIYRTHAKHLIYAEKAKGITRRNIKIVTCKNKQMGRMREAMLQYCLPPHWGSILLLKLSRFLSPSLKKDCWSWFAVQHNLLLQSATVFIVLFHCVYGSSKLCF